MQLFGIKLCLLIVFLSIQTGSLLAQKKVSCSLDSLMDFPNCWEMTPEMFERSFSKKGSKKSPPIYKWLTTDKSRVKFSRNLYAGAEIDLFLFDQQIKAVEVVADFRNGKLNLITFSIYNRGDSGAISTEKFKEHYMLCGKAMSQKLKVRPSVRKAHKQQGLKTAGSFSLTGASSSGQRGTPPTSWR